MEPLDDFQNIATSTKPWSTWVDAGDLRLLVVVGTRLGTGADPQGSKHAVPVGGDE